MLLSLHVIVNGITFYILSRGASINYVFNDKIFSRAIRTLNFTRKTTNVVLSDLQIVDVVKWFFKKLQIRSSRDLHNLWICPPQFWCNSYMEFCHKIFFVKFCKNRQIQSTKINQGPQHQIILPKIKNLQLKMLKIALKVEGP